MSVIDRLVNYRNRVLTYAQRAAGADTVLGVRSSDGAVYTFDGSPFAGGGGTVFSSLTVGAAGRTFINDGGVQVSGSTSGSALFTVSGSVGGALVRATSTGTAPFMDFDFVGTGSANGTYRLGRASTTMTGGSTQLQAYVPGTATLTWRFYLDTGVHVFSKAKTAGIKVDPAVPTYGWKDIIGNITVRGVSANDPSWNVYQTNIRQYQFTVNDEIWFVHHIPHDYADSTDLFFHIHWSHASASVTSGSVTWTIQSTYAKGHNQGAFPATKQTTVTQTASTTQYQHMIGEVQITTSTPGGDATRFDRATIEPDGVLISRVFLSANSMNGTPEPFMHFADVHYQSTSLGTKQKAPDFWT
jgi:hypothetical protein